LNFFAATMLSYQYAPAVAAVLVAYARADFLDDTLSSLAAYDFSPFADPGGMCSLRQRSSITDHIN
jgi:hypothetical protein